ncbi:DUF6969 family protein [Denitromonas iodatirespirans]|uniref:DUF6969 domain-containing protein n=1 Tax=Denitromonas iodatirespirans TaxID=2795389 RepID=A0A944DDR2_DENI1|nr:hypothetical protein [Denitromonas iodatirespirans]MBT0963612.1 hypothetical protein [Denitromonas iodatirespirans]
MSATLRLDDFLPALASIPRARRLQMQAAARDMAECYRVLRKGGLNVVGEVLRGGGAFVEMSHYPEDDVYDRDSHAQYYYHAHRGVDAEHGHFHTFVRAAGIPEGLAPLALPHASAPRPSGDDAICHLIAVSMDGWGYPSGLFTTNRWVTDESWYPAEAAIAILPRFEIDHAFPSWPTNRWLSALLRLYGPQIEGLLRHRDEVMARCQAARPGEDVYEDRNIDVIGYLPIAVDTFSDALTESLR